MEAPIAIFSNISKFKPLCTYTLPGYIVFPDEEDNKRKTLILGLTADEVAGLGAGILVVIIILVTFSLLLCVFVTLRRRRKAAGESGKEMCVSFIAE